MPLAQPEDASRRTWLASERTWLAWVRTGLAATGLAVGVGKLVPEVITASDSWAYAALGAGYGALGVMFVVYGLVRRREVDAALRRGDGIPSDDRVLLALVGCAAVLGTLTIVLVVA